MPLFRKTAGHPKEFAAFTAGCSGQSKAVTNKALARPEVLGEDLERLVASQTVPVTFTIAGVTIVPNFFMGH